MFIFLANQSIDFDNVTDTAQELLNEIIEIQGRSTVIALRDTLWNVPEQLTRPIESSAQHVLRAHAILIYACFTIISNISYRVCN